jgi:hypothetical protein
VSVNLGLHQGSSQFEMALRMCANRWEAFVAGANGTRKPTRPNKLTGECTPHRVISASENFPNYLQKIRRFTRSMSLRSGYFYLWRSAMFAGCDLSAETQVMFQRFKSEGGQLFIEQAELRFRFAPKFGL